MPNMGQLQLAPGTLYANRFAVERAAGSGGMGTVYRATDRYSGETVALKLLHSSRSSSDEAERFAREAQLLSELRHPGIVSYVAHGQTPDGQRFLAMEWLDGEDLGERLTRGPLPVHDCLGLVAQIADALSVAHERGIIHRDLKPTNLFLVHGDVQRVKILDFGIARRLATSRAMTKTGMVVGTPEYMAPEQARGARALTPAADLFSLGCVLYECLSGAPPFVADHIAALLVQILFEEPIPIALRRPGVPAAISELLGRLLAKDPGQRLADAAALRVELLRVDDLELPEPAWAQTMASPQLPAASFADQEQSLFSVVLAASHEDHLGLGATHAGDSGSLVSADKPALLKALAAPGSTADFLANGTLVVTVSPIGSAQDQATLAARAALLIKQRWPEAVVSMATGRGAVRGFTAIGEVVELAARSLRSGSYPSMATAPAGVLIDSLSAKLLEGRFAQTPQPVGALLLSEDLDEDVSRPLLGKPTPCVGREAELGILEAQLASCIEESAARAVLFTAPPGAGKSRLRHTFLRRLEERKESITVLLGRGDMMNAGEPYGILRTAILKLCGIHGSEPLVMQRERLEARVAHHVAPGDKKRVVCFVGELCRIPFSEEQDPVLQAARQDLKIMRDQLRRALLNFLAAECAVAPVLLVLDDLQWSDGLTVSVLDEAMREQAEAPLFVLAFARPEMHEVFPRLWAGHKLHDIPLKGLSKRACERLIKQTLGSEIDPSLIASAVEQAAGNAFFLEELIRSIAEGTFETQSETVLAMLQARIGRLDAGMRRTVRAAAIFGQTFWAGGVAAILGLPKQSAEVEACLTRLADAELIQPHSQSRLMDETECAFRHGLAREAAYTLLTDSDLTTGHRLAAEFLEAAGEPSSAVIAEHFERGGVKRRAADYYLRAAEDSLERGEYLGVQRYAARGLDCAPAEAVAGQLYAAFCYAGYFLNRYVQVEERATLAMKLLSVGSLGWCRAIFSAFYAVEVRQDRSRSWDFLSLLLHAEPEPNARSSYLESISQACALMVLFAPEWLILTIGARIAAVAEESQRTLPALRRYLHRYNALVSHFRYPRPWTYLLEVRQTIRLAEEVGDFRMALELRIYIEVGWLQVGDHDGAYQRLLALEPEITTGQHILYLAAWQCYLAENLCESLDDSAWEQAEHLGLLLQAYTSEIPLLAALGQGILARVAFLRGNLEEAERLSRLGLQFLQVAPLWVISIVSIQTRALIGLGRAAEAVVNVESVLAMIPPLVGAGSTEVELRLAASEAFQAAGHHERAQAELRETLRQVQLRADDITDAFWKSSYLTRNPYCVRTLQLAKEWGLAVAVPENATGAELGDAGFRAAT